ncbi:MAG: hypothetical protein ACKV2O_15555 [Acidimicrobiales bacterium]
MLGHAALQAAQVTEILVPDGAGRFDLDANEQFHAGIVLYAGHSVSPFGSRMLAVPISALWLATR